MKTAKIYFFYFFVLFNLLFAGCTKETLSDEDKAVTRVNVYDDANIRIPLEIVAGNGTLLSAYYLYDTNNISFLLTDDKGKQIWIKDFNVTELTGMVAENDGTFTLFDNRRRINIDVNGNVLSDEPNFLAEIGDYGIMHVIINRAGNYFFYGTNTTFSAFVRYGFAFEITHSGLKVFKKIFTINTIFTGCQLTPDGGYLFLGNYTPANSFPSQFFICKMSSGGVISWTKNHISPGSGVTDGKNYFYTHDLLESNDGNYFCFVGSANFDITTAARIYKVNPDGELIDSTDINFAGRNIFAGGSENNLSTISYPRLNGYCSARKSDGTFVVYLNNMGLTNASYAVGGNQTFSFHFNDDLSLNHLDYIQNIYPDYFTSVCKTSDDKIALFGLINSFGGYEKPAILISE
jgi:hypothetical protein